MTVYNPEYFDREKSFVGGAVGVHAYDSQETDSLDHRIRLKRSHMESGIIPGWVSKIRKAGSSLEDWEDVGKRRSRKGEN